MNDATKRTRVGVYIDGYNVYHGMKRQGWGHLLWLDYVGLLTSILQPGQELESVKYFTALAKNSDSRQRQMTYLEALAITGGLDVIYGRAENRRQKCGQCGHKWKRQEEKETDVRMALAMILDACNQQVDELWLMSRDSDLVPAVEAVREETGLKVLIILPPNTPGQSDAGGGGALVSASGGGGFVIPRKHWEANQLDESLQRKPTAKRVKKPTEWY